MSSQIYEYQVDNDLYTIYTVNVTVVDYDHPDTKHERSKVFKFKTREQALWFLSDLWNNKFPEEEFFYQCLVVRTNLMRSGKQL